MTQTSAHGGPTTFAEAAECWSHPILLACCNNSEIDEQQVYQNMANSDVVKVEPVSQQTSAKQTAAKSARIEAGTKLRDADKMSLIPVQIVPVDREQMLRKPECVESAVASVTENIDNLRKAMRKHGLHSVCEEAS